MLRIDFFGFTYDDEVPAFLVINDLAYNRINGKYYDLATLQTLAANENYLFHRYEMDILPAEFEGHYLNVPPDLDDINPVLDPDVLITVAANLGLGEVAFDDGPQGVSGQSLTVGYTFSTGSPETIVIPVPAGTTATGLAGILAAETIVGGTAVQAGDIVTIAPDSGTLDALSAAIA